MKSIPGRDDFIISEKIVDGLMVCGVIDSSAKKEYTLYFLDLFSKKYYNNAKIIEEKIIECFPTIPEILIYLLSGLCLCYSDKNAALDVKYEDGRSIEEKKYYIEFQSIIEMSCAIESLECYFDSFCDDE